MSTTSPDTLHQVTQHYPLPLFHLPSPHPQPPRTHKKNAFLTYPVHGEPTADAIKDASDHEHNQTPASRPVRRPRQSFNDRAEEEKHGRDEQLSASTQVVTDLEADQGSDNCTLGGIGGGGVGGGG